MNVSRLPRWTLWLRQAINRRYDDFSHWAFVQKLRLQVLPNDEEHREGFDVPADFRIGDPNVHFQAAAAKPHETSGATGKPEWASLFGFILARMSHLRFLSTVYVLVDNRDPTNLDNLNLLCNTGLLRPGGPAVLACRVLPRSAVTLCTSPLAKPVVSIWFTPLGPAPLSLRPFAWSFRVFRSLFGSSRLGSNPRGQVVLVFPVTTLQWFPGRFFATTLQWFPETYCSWLYLDTTR